MYRYILFIIFFLSEIISGQIINDIYRATSANTFETASSLVSATSGNAYDILYSSAPSDDISNFEAEYQAVLNEAVNIGAILPTIANQRLQNDKIVALKATGYFQTADAIFDFTGNGNFAFKSINQKNPTGAKAEQLETSNLTVSNTGIKGDGVGYLKLNETLSNYTLNSAGIVLDFTESNATNNALVEAALGFDTNTRMVNLSTWLYLNSNATTRAIVNVSTDGLYIFSRTSATAISASKDGVLLGNYNFNSVAMPTSGFNLFRNGTSGRGVSRISYFMLSNSIGANYLSVYNAIRSAPAVTTTGGIYSEGYTP